MVNIPYPKEIQLSDYNKTWHFDLEDDYVKGVFLID